MAKIFRLHKEGSNTLQDWDNSNRYSTHVIGQIADPNGASAQKEITSIPSPFARMDLVKSAFKEVVNSNNPDGNTIYHKMVSDSLDVGQIFFEIDKYRDDIEIIVWDRQKDLDTLLNSKISGHKSFGETLQMFLTQDAAAFNFNQLQRIYLLNYKIGPSRINIIGATSPATIFFTSANNLGYVSNKIQFGQDKPFDSQYRSLYKRDMEYQKLWYFLQSNIPGFATQFPEVDGYLNLCYQKLGTQDKQIILGTNISDTNFNEINVNVNAGNKVEVLGYSIYSRKINIPRNSDFEILSSHMVNNQKPLVLPVDTFTTKAIYLQEEWDRLNKAPICDSRPLQNRTLPFDGAPYPYLTISDFLEETIIRLPSELNANAFFDGNQSRSNGISYLLPIKSLFFDFFTKEDLCGTLANGQKMFELIPIATGVSVVLRIPIQKGFVIEYHRTYFENNEPKIDATNNDGGLIDHDFTFAIFPNIEFNETTTAHYRFALIPENKAVENYTFTCFKNNQPLPLQLIIRNDNYSKTFKCRIGVLEGSSFDYAQIKISGKHGIVIPKLHKQSGTDQFKFSIDFGTTNTHIEYSVNGSPSKPFDIQNTDQQIHQLLSTTEKTAQYITDFDIIPNLVGDKSVFKFPLRTALSEAKNISWNNPVIPIAHANIPFPYEKRNDYPYNKTITGLKWSNDLNNTKRIKCYIESLFLILRNKVILNNGDLSQTKIVWFYPISMTRHRFNLFKSEWEAAYKKYFSNNINNIIPVTESIAPYEYYKRGFGANANMVNIDIGGGTTDVLISENGDIKHISSFRFAANSIFGNGYGDNNGLKKNGIINQFDAQLEQLISDNLKNDSEIKDIYNNLKQKNDSADLATFFFSLVENEKLGGSINFSEILMKDDSQKMVFVIFYVAIIYHLAQIMKLKTIKMPRYLSFSGNGSKIIQILTTDKKHLEHFTKLIFEKVYGEKYNSNGLTIHEISKTPKEATCKGGIACQVAQDYSQISETKTVLLSAEKSIFIGTETYKSINNDIIEVVGTEASNFIKLIFVLNSEFSFKNNFGVDNTSIEIARKVCFKDLDEFIRTGLSRKKQDVSDDDTIEETLFFYPLNGVLVALADAIYERKINS